MNSTSPGGLPDATASGIGHMAYKQSLYDELEYLTKRINELGGDSSIGDTVFELESQVEI